MKFQSQIEAGAKLLDEKLGPVWLDRQNLEKLNLSDPSNCVIGQSCPDKPYVEVLEGLFGINSENDYKDHVFHLSDNHGFATDICQNYPQLTEEWKQYIQKRREQNGR